MVSRGPSSLTSGTPQSTVPVLGALRVEQGRGWLCRSPLLHGCLKQAQAQSVCVCWGGGSPRVEELVSAIMGAAQTHSDWSQGLRQASSMPDGGKTHLGPSDFSSASNDFTNQRYSLHHPPYPPIHT